MKQNRKKYSILLFAIFFLIVCFVAIHTVYAVANESVTFIQSGKTLWHYRVTTTEEFEKVDSDWYINGFDTSSWRKGVSPFGDRIANSTDSGWEGDFHGIFLVTTFDVLDTSAIPSLSMHIFYDNTVAIYLNGQQVFSDNGWNDAPEDIIVSSEFLQNGKNTFAVSLLDDVGGRAFDLTLKASEEQAPPAVTTPSQNQVITAGKTPWHYQVTTTDGFHAMDSAWKNEGYDTSSWQVGQGPFGDCIDSANATRSGWKGENHGIFLVTTFEIDDLEKAKKQYYYAEMYFDNTITIYLNGTRVFYHERWNTSYEEIALGFKNYLKEGTNTLAVSLLDDVGGREFDMSLYLTDRVVLPGIEVGEEELTEAGLPILRIDTASGDYVRSRLDYVDATMVFENLGAYPDEDHMYTEDGGAAIEIRGRGNSTWNNGYPDGKPNTLPGDTHTRKVPYNIKLAKKTDLFGMGKSKKWVLLANYMDRTNLRNKLIFDLSGRMGMTYPQSVFINLVLNGEYMGVYALCEKVDIDLFEGAVTDFEDYAEDFAKGVAKQYGHDEDWQSDFEDELCENLSWLTEDTYKGYRVADFVDLSDVSTEGGYLIEYDGYADEDSFFTTKHGVPLKVSNLEYIKSNPEVFNNLKAYFNEFEEALFSDTFYNTQGKHYSEYLDMQSFVDYYILNALILNVEFGYKSMYMVLGTDGKITLGPCWDYDWSSGNPFLGANGQYNEWYNDGRANNNKWYREVYGDPWFVSLVRERWFTLADAIDDMIESMDYYEDYLLPSTVIEYRKFKADSYERDFAGRTGGRSFSQEVARLRTFLINRYNWMNLQFEKREPNIEGFGMKTSASLTLALNGATFESERFDFYTNGSVTLTVNSAHSGKAVIYLNGIRYAELALTNSHPASCLVSYEGLDKGVNTLTVYGYDSANNQFGINYLTLETPGEKTTAPTLGSFLPTQEGGFNPPITPPETDAPIVEPPTPETIPLAADTVDVYMQTKETATETQSLRMVFVVDKNYLDSFSFWNVSVVFSAKDGETKRYEALLGAGGNYELFRNVTADGDIYTAADGDLLFGNIFTDIPRGVLKSLTVMVTDNANKTIFNGSADFS